MKMVSTLLCLSCIGLASASPAIENPTNASALIQSDEFFDKALVENSLRHKILIADSLDQKMNILDRMHYYNVPCIIISIVNNGKIAWASGYGNITNGNPFKAVDEHTLFQAGSISKSLTAYGSLLLVQQGKIDLDEDVNTYLRSWKIPENEFTQTEKVTLRRLLSHTAGTSVHGFPGYTVGDSIPSTIDVLDGVKPLVNTDPVRVIMQPGTKFKYSGGGTTIVQLLIEDITGEKFDDWMQTNVLTPLGMSESTFSQPFSLTHADRAAYGHQREEKVEGHWHIYPEKAAAGLWSTPTDLAKFLLHIQSALKAESTLLLNPILVREMITRQMLSGEEDDPGLGFFISHEGEDLAFAHGGQDEGFIASFYGLAARNQGLVIMMNQDAGWFLMGEIQNSVGDTYGWPNFTPLKKQSLPLNTSILGDLQGKFTSQDEEIEVSVIEDKPYVRFQFDQVSELFRQSDHVYFIKEEDVTLEFVIAPSNKIEAIVVTDPNKKTIVFQRT